MKESSNIHSKQHSTTSLPAPQQGRARLNLHDLTAIAMMAAVLGVLAQIAIPLGPVPFTLQTVGLIMLTLLLPRKNAMLAIAVYLLIGAIGLPVFSGGRGGLGILAGPSGGFLWGFFPGAWLGSGLLKRGLSTPLPRVYAAATLALACSFAWGVLHFAALNGVTVQQAFITAALPFLAIDALKIVLCTPLLWKMRRILHHQLPQRF